MPLSVEFDVNDERLRDQFLSDLLPRALEFLHERVQPAWGHMSPQEMVEHLAWAFDLSTGEQQTDCPLPEQRRERMKPYLYSNQPSPQKFMNPVLTSGLPPLKHPNLTAAKDALNTARRRFLEQSESVTQAMRTHPVFGPLGREEWSRTHFKHAFHHLSQFRLIAAASALEAGETPAPEAAGSGATA